jgi:hypothetical protein
MTDNASRQPKGIPAGGQFAATEHAETSISLTPRRPELNGWPESLPEPEVSFHVGDDGVITTNVEINGEPAFEVWNPGDDVHSIETTQFDHPDLADNDCFEEAENWAKDKHNEIADDLRTEMHAAVERSRARVLAKATGTSPQLTDDELGALVGLNQTAAYNGKRDAEFAATAVIARGILKDHPDASHIGLRIDSGDGNEFVAGAVVYNADHEAIGSYNADAQYLTGPDDEDESYRGAGFVEHFNGLTASPDNAWWTAYNLPVSQPDDFFTIDLAKAAAWTPGADA